jgi:dCMP deaminase
MGSNNESLLKWDKYFFDIASAVSRNSSCMSRQIGCLLVKDKTIICEGYNGPPRGVPHCGERYQIDEEMRNYLESKHANPDDPNNIKKCPRYVMGYKSGQGLQWCVAGHAERNALINAARMGIQTKGCTLYMDCGIPCTPCLVEIINAGIEEIVVSGFSFYDVSARYLLNNSELSFRIYSHLCEHKDLTPDTMAHRIIKGHCRDCGINLEV